MDVQNGPSIYSLESTMYVNFRKRKGKNRLASVFYFYYIQDRTYDVKNME